MTGPLSIGVGCRAGCPADEIAALVEQAWRLADRHREARIVSVLDKSGEAGLIAAAAALDLPLGFLPRAALAAVSPGVVTASPASQSRFGLPSVAEAAALAGAGAGARLVVPRIVAARATCAVAVPAGDRP